MGGIRARGTPWSAEPSAKAPKEYSSDPEAVQKREDPDFQLLLAQEPYTLCIYDKSGIF